MFGAIPVFVGGAVYYYRKKRAEFEHHNLLFRQIRLPNDQWANLEEVVAYYNETMFSGKNIEIKTAVATTPRGMKRNRPGERMTIMIVPSVPQIAETAGSPPIYEQSPKQTTNDPVSGGATVASITSPNTLTKKA